MITSPQNNREHKQRTLYDSHVFTPRCVHEEQTKSAASVILVSHQLSFSPGPAVELRVRPLNPTALLKPAAVVKTLLAVVHGSRNKWRSSSISPLKASAKLLNNGCWFAAACDPDSDRYVQVRSSRARSPRL